MPAPTALLRAQERLIEEQPTTNLQNGEQFQFRTAYISVNPTQAKTGPQIQS